MTPDFINQIVTTYQAGKSHAFILHGNAYDYVVPGLNLNDYLTKMLSTRCVVFYNRSKGFSFPSPSCERQFIQAVGLNQTQEPDNPALSALRQVRGQSQTPQSPALPTSPDSALPLIEKFIMTSEPGTAAVVIEYAETITPNGDIMTMSATDRTNLVTLSRWGRDPEIESRGQFIFLVTEAIDQINDSLKTAGNKYSVIEVPYPNQAERQAFIEWYLEAKAGEFSGVKMELTPGELANMTAGLNRVHIEDIFLIALIEGSLTAETVKNRKNQIIGNEYGEVLEIMEPQGGFETIGGLDYIKGYFSRSVINPMRQGNTRRVPMGVLMLGPAGTGKSIMATAVAKEAGINAVKLNIGGQIASKWQGEGERKLAKALRGILNFAPTIVFIDEIDQTISRGSGNNQQDSRIFQMLLEFMAETDHRGKVVFLAASNRPDLIDPALLRAGRFDDKIAFLVPSQDERTSIFEVFNRKFGIGLTSIPTQAVESTDGYTGAEIEAICRKAATLIEDEGLTPGEAVIEASRRIKATTRAIEYMTALAINEISDLDLLPPGARELAQDTKAVEAIIENTAPKIRGAREL